MNGQTRSGRIRQLKDSWYDDGKKPHQAALVLERLFTESDFLLSDCKALRSCLVQCKDLLVRLPLNSEHRGDIMLLLNKIVAVLESTR